jgi:hypothetical protein
MVSLVARTWLYLSDLILNDLTATCEFSANY